jgi:Putative Ig domain
VLRIALLLVIGMVLVFGVSALVGHSSHSSASIGHALHSSAGLEVVPAQAFGTTTLHARLAGVRGPNGDVTSCRWLKNGDPIPGTSTGTLTPDAFHKGDTIVAEATSEPGQPPVRSNGVVIRNTPPRIVTAAALLKTDPGASIYVAVSAVDADGDPITESYAWQRNGKDIPGQTGSTIDPSLFQKGDKVSVRVTALDGEGESAEYVSSPVVFGSNAPAITSAPPTALEDGGRFVYDVKASAPDPGALKYELVDAPDGMTINGTGRVQWTVPPDTTGTQQYGVTIRVSDPTGGSSTQTFQLSAVPPEKH